MINQFSSMYQPGMGPLPGYADYKSRRLSPMPYSTGMPPLDMFMMMQLGSNMMPVPQPGSTQGLIDAFVNRQRDMDFLAIRNQALAKSLFAQKLGGFNPKSPLFQAAAGFLGEPDSVAAKFMSPFIGGNPMKAQMGLYANMTAQSMGTFGQLSGINVGDSTRIMDSLYKPFYKHATVDDAFLRASQTNIINQAQNRFGSSPLRDEVTGLFDNKGMVIQGRMNRMRNTYGGLEQAQSLLAGTTDVNSAAFQKQKQAIIDAYTDPKVKDTLKDAFAKGIEKGGGKAGASEIDRMYQIRAMNSLLPGIGTHFSQQQSYNKSIAQYVDFANTRGFKIEDFTSSLSSAAANNLFRSKDFTGNMEKFFNKTGAPVMDAARGLFGNRMDGKELMNSISGLLGASHVDMGSTADASRLEDFMRRIKSMAAVADVSVETILGIINTGKQLAQSHPSMQYLGGYEVGQMALKAIPMAQAQAAFLDNDYVRRNGGVAGLVQQNMGGMMMMAGQPITRQLAAAHHYFSTRGDQAALNAISSYANNPGANHQEIGMNNFLRSIAGRGGLTPNELVDYTRNNTEAQALGLRAAPELAQAARHSAMEQLDMLMYRKIGMTRGMGAYQNSRRTLRSVLSGEGVDVAQYLNNLQGADTHAGSRSLAEKIGQALKGTDVSFSQFAGMSSDERNALSSTGAAAFNSLNSLLQGRYHSGDRKVLGLAMTHRGVDPSLLTTMFPSIASTPEAMELLKKYEPIFREGALSGSSNIYRGFVRNIHTRINQRTMEDKELSEKYGHLNAPLTTQFFNKLLDGDLSKDGLTAILAPLRLKEGDAIYGQVQQLAEQTAKMASAPNAQSIADIARQSFGMNINGDELQSLQSLGNDMDPLLKGTGWSVNSVIRAMSGKDNDADRNKVWERIRGRVGEKDRDKFDALRGRIGADGRLSLLNILGVGSEYKGNFSNEDIRGIIAGSGVDKIRAQLIAPQLGKMDATFAGEISSMMGTKGAGVVDANIKDKIKAVQEALKASGLGGSAEDMASVMFGASSTADKGYLSKVTKAQGLLASSLGLKGDDIAGQLTGVFRDGQLKPFTSTVMEAKDARDRFINRTKSGMSGAEESNDIMRSIEKLLRSLTNSVGPEGGKSMTSLLSELINTLDSA